MKIETCHVLQLKMIAESELESVFLQEFLEKAPREFLNLIQFSSDEDNPSFTEEKFTENELPASQIWGVEFNWNN